MALKSFFGYSLVRLGTDYVDVYRPARLDPEVPMPRFVPTLGMRTLHQLDEALAARPLTAEHIGEVETVAPRGSIAGSRYSAAHMAALDSERR